MKRLALLAVFLVLAISSPSTADDWRPPEGRYDDGHYRVECREFDHCGVCMDD
jgi:hypothetical protein